MPGRCVLAGRGLDGVAPGTRERAGRREPRRHPTRRGLAGEAEAEGAVWVAKGGRAHKQAVTVGIRDLLRVQVLTGLAEGDEVVVEGQDKLAEGARVAAVTKPADKMKPVPDQSQPNQNGIR